jgi:hypothetical protein
MAIVGERHMSNLVGHKRTIATGGEAELSTSSLVRKWKRRNRKKVFNHAIRHYALGISNRQTIYSRKHSRSTHVIFAKDHLLLA